MQVSDFQIEKTKQGTTVSAHFTFSRAFGTKRERLLSYWHTFLKAPLQFFKYGRHTQQRIWFFIPSPFDTNIWHEDAFFVLAVGMTLCLNEDLRFEGSVSPSLLAKLPQLKEYFDYGLTNRPIHITYKTGKTPHDKRHGVAQFFTLGVDSFHTLLCYKPRKKRALLYVDGFDVPLQHEKFIKEIHHRIESVANSAGNRATFIRTNVREISDKVIGWGQYHVTALSSVGILLPFNEVYISGETFDWPDWGLRTGVDKLFSYEDFALTVVGHNVRRDITLKKILQTKQKQLFLRNVRTCWANILEKEIPYNCSHCQKCYRTMLTLQALGIRSTPTFAPIDLQELDKIVLNIHIFEEWKVVEQLLCRTKASDPKLLRVIRHILEKPMSPVSQSFKTITL